MISPQHIFRTGLVLVLTLGLNSLCHSATILNLGSGPNVGNSNSAVGINLQRPDSWSPDYLFLDAILKARNWIPHACDFSAWDNHTAIQTDSEGWVTDVAPNTCPGLVLLDEEDEAAAHYVPLGTYIIVWEGEGTLSFQLVPNAQATCKTASCQVVDARTISSTGPGPHKATFTLDNSNFIRTDLRILAFNRSQPIRRIKVLMPGGHMVTGSKIDYKSYCRTARGPTGPLPTGAVETVGRNQSCRDFERTYWDRYSDSLTLLHRYTDVTRTTLPVKALFHPLTLQNLARARFIRAMDWLHTNNSTITSWSQRTAYKHQNQTESEHGLAFEYLISLANVLGADLWVNIPHQARLDYVTQLATLLRDNLHPRLRVYTEYSNEIWNGAFTQGTWIQNQGLAKYPNAAWPFLARLQFQSFQAASFADEFNRVFGTNASRVVNVISGQAANSDIGNTLLGFSNTASHFSAYAIAPYFAGMINIPPYPLPDPPPPDITTADALFAEITATGIPGALDWVAQNKQMVADTNLRLGTNVRLITYEAGQHLAYYNDKYTSLYVAANRDARMGPATTSYVNQLKTSGIGEISYFNDLTTYRRFGSWGAKETLLQNSTPKADALQTFMGTTACWWTNCGR
jgi:hypothetical protein